MSRRRRDILALDWWKPPTFRTESVPVVDGIATLPDGRTSASGSQWILYPVATGQEPITRRDLSRLRSWRLWRRFSVRAVGVPMRTADANDGSPSTLALILSGCSSWAVYVIGPTRALRYAEAGARRLIRYRLDDGPWHWLRADS